MHDVAALAARGNAVRIRGLAPIGCCPTTSSGAGVSLRAPGGQRRIVRQTFTRCWRSVPGRCAPDSGREPNPSRKTLGGYLVDHADRCGGWLQPPVGPGRLVERLTAFILAVLFVVVGAALPATADDATLPETVQPVSTGFVDVPPEHRFHAAVTWLVAEGITQGTSPTTFDPTTEITRSQLAVFLWRYRGSPAPEGTHGFSDIPTGAGYADAVAWLGEAGIAAGVTTQEFRPTAPVTRQQMAVFLWRAFAQPASWGWGAGFSDVPYDSAAEPAIRWLVDRGITLGKTADEFAPGDLVTRGQMAAFLHRLPTSEVSVHHLVIEGQSPRADSVAAIRHEVEIVDAWFRSQTDGRGLRWARDTAGQIPITMHRVPVAVAQAGGFEITGYLLEEGVDDRNDVHLVYADLAEDQMGCGYSYGGFAILVMPACDIYPSTSATMFRNGATYLTVHELTHAIGAVPDCAPNAGNGGHVIDDNRDVLYAGPGNRDWDNLMLDPGRDDYYGHGRTDCADIANHPVWTR